MASQVDDEENFLILERIYLRLANAKDSSQLSSFSAKQLPVLFEKLAANINGQQNSSRDKILEILSRLKNRLRSNPDAVLPIEFLLKEYKNEASTLSKNFSFIFLKVGFTRLSLPEQINFVPILLKAVANKRHKEQLEAWCLLLPVLRYYGQRNKRAKDDEESQPFDLSSLDLPPASTAKFLDFCAQFVLLPDNFYSKSNKRPEGSDTEDQEGAPAPAAAIPTGIAAITFASLLEAIRSSTLAFLAEMVETSKSDSSPLIETKIGIVRMLAVCGLPSEDVAWVWCLASSDAHHSVVHEAEMSLKQAPGSGANHISSIRKLYDYYLGTSSVQTVPENERHVAAGLRVKLKLMTYFLRYADTASTAFPQSIQVLFENWFGRSKEIKVFNMTITESDEKLQLAGTEFALDVVSKLNTKTAGVFGPLIFANVKKLMDSNDSPKLGCLCYAVLGSLGKLHPNVVLVGNKRLEMIQDLFDDLSQIQNDDICKTAQACLFDWLDGIMKHSGYKNEHLETCVLAYAENKSSKCRIAALRFIEKLFPVNHAPSRFALFLGLSDKNEKVRLEATAILKRTANALDKQEDNEDAFEEACRYFCEKVAKIFERRDLQSDGSPGLASGSLKQIIRYLRQRLYAYVRGRRNKAKMDVDVLSLEEIENEDNLALEDYLSAATSSKEWRPYMELLVSYLEKFGATDEDILEYVSEMVFLVPEPVLRQDVLPLFSRVTPTVSETLKNTTKEKLVAQLTEILAIIYAMTKESAFVSREFETSIQHFQKEKFLLLVHVYLPSVLCEQLNMDESRYARQLTSYSQIVCDRFCQSVAKNEPANLDVTLHCLKPLALKGALRRALPDDQVRQAVYTAALEVIRSRKDTVTTRHKKGCLDFIGCWMTGEPDLPQWQKVMDEIIKPLEGPPNIGLQPSIGNVLANYCVSPVGCTVYGGTRARYTESTNRMRKRLTERMTVAGAKVDESERRMDAVLKHLLVGEEADRSWTNKNHKQAVCVWMESFLRICGQCEPVQGYLDRLQTFFISCLADKDDFTQDIARRGLFLMFRCTREAEQRSLLARSMREELTATTAKETLLPYQELCVLCAATCQCPELIYDLMLLALNRQPKNKDPTEQAIRNNVSSMVAVAVSKLDVYECLLVPLFFRFTYDPIASVKRVFQNVWASINECNRKRSASEGEGKGGETLVEKYAGAIFDQLMADLESGQWRYREASCTALNDFLNGPHVGAFNIRHLGELWQRCLRVLDDMKESVGLAAARMVKALRSFTVRLCSPDGSPSTVLPVVMPVLVEFGLQNNATLVRISSLSILMKLIKEAPPKFLKPHLPALMASFLDALTWTEHEKINYLSVRAGDREREQIDQARISASKSSPIMDSLELCTRHVDQAVLQSLIPKVIHIFQSNVGLATKSGACRLLYLLRSQAPNDLGPFADSLLKCLTRCLADRNTTFRKQCASTIGQIAPLCSESALGQFFSTVQRWYLDIENPAMELSCAYALRAIATDAPEVLRKFGAQAAPIAFIAAQNTAPEGQRDDQSSESSSLEQIWEEVTAELTLSLYIFDVYDLCARLLFESPSWRMKAVTAKTVGVLVEKMSADLPSDKLSAIISMLMKALEGRTWDGKEYVLIALGTTAAKYSQTLNRVLQEAEKNLLMEALLKECQKTNKPKYRVHAVVQTGIVAEAVSLEMWDRMWCILAPCFGQEKEDASESDDQEASGDCRQAAYVSLARCLRQKDIQANGDDVLHFVSLLIARLPKSMWREQLSILEAVLIILNKKLSIGGFDLFSLMGTLLTAIDQTRQMAVKQRCVSALRSCCDCIVDRAPNAEQWETSPAPGEVIQRFLENDNVNNFARDLIEKMRAYWKR